MRSLNKFIGVMNKNYHSSVELCWEEHYSTVNGCKTQLNALKGRKNSVFELSFLNTM